MFVAFNFSPRTHDSPLRSRCSAAEQEEALIDMLIKVCAAVPLAPTLPTHTPPQSVSKSSVVDTVKIVADILTFLPHSMTAAQHAMGMSLSACYSHRWAPHSARTSPGCNPVNLDQSCVYLELPNLLCCTKGTAWPM